MIFNIRNLLCLVIMAVSAIEAYSAEPIDNDPYELDLETNINTPVISSKKSEQVKAGINRLKQSFDRAGFKTKRIRDGQALVLTIPVAHLFKPNEVVLSPQGINCLSKINFTDDDSNDYKILVAVHTDNTGDQSYRDSLTVSRANAIDDFLAPRLMTLGILVVPYGLGSDDPVNDNDSLLKRANNRRVELYIIPTLQSQSK